MRQVRHPDSDDSYDESYDRTPLPPPRPRRRSPVPPTSSSSSSSHNHNRRHNPNGSVVMNKTFQKLLLLLFVIVIFDMVYVWDYFDGLDENSGGPEAGLHHLHESRRLGNLYQHVLKGLQMVKSSSSSKGGGNSGRMDFLELENLSDGEKIEMLEHEVEAWRNKYEEAVAMSSGGRGGVGGNGNHNPFAGIPVTPVPPNGGDDDDGVVRKPKKSRAELERMETYGADDRIVKILHSGNVEIDKELAGELPTWEDVVSLYGEEPIIYGLDTCEPYRNAVAPEDRMIGPAGMFNTGTNLLFELMKSNCDIKEAHTKRREPRRNGMRWQVPWGKHNPPTTHRFQNVAKAWGKGIKQDDFMPVVLIKDPYTWMGSQCRHKYTTFWGHDQKHCPNLIRWRVQEEDVPSEVRVKYALQMKMYESLLDMWNHWYEEWEEQTFPHLTTRFEDLLFHGEEVTRKACECVGGDFTENFEYVEDSAKPTRGVHKGANGLVKAILQYGDPTKRLNGFTDRDRLYASKTMDTALMRKYGYVAPPLPTGDE